MPAGAPPLAGVRVVSCEIGLAGPLCTRLLADLGADVVKIERPGSGDVTRGWDTAVRGLSSGFVWVNRGKRSVALDVTRRASRPALERLVAGADVFLQNFAPGWADRVALDERSVRALREDVIYTEISGYSKAGPYADQTAYDLVMQGETGLIELTGTPAEPARVAISICDIGAACYAALGVLAALLRRRETGNGEHVSVALFDVMLDWLGYFPHLWWHRRESPVRTGMRHPLFCPYGPYAARSGRLFSLAVLSPDHWRTFCLDVVERPDLLDDERYATNEGRVEHRAELESLLEEVFEGHDASEWLLRLERAGIPSGRVNALPEVMAHPELADGDLVAEIGSPVGSIPTIASAILLGDGRPPVGDVPALGEHTHAVLAELGFGKREIEALTANG